MKIAGKREVWKVTDLVPNNWNPNVQSEFMFEREKASIKEFGFVDPVTIRVANEHGPLKNKDSKLVGQILDGEHRWKAASELGMKEVSVENLGKVSDVKAKALTDLLNKLRGEPDEMKQAELIASVLAEQPDLASILPYTETELDEFQAMLNFDWNALDTNDPDADNTMGVNPRLILEFSSEQKHAAARDAIAKAARKKEPAGDTLVRLLKLRAPRKKPPPPKKKEPKAEAAS